MMEALCTLQYKYFPVQQLVSANIVMPLYITLIHIVRSLFSTFRSCSRSLYMLLPVRLSVVCNVRAPYSGGSNFRQFFYGVGHLGHPLTRTENFMEILPGEPLCQGS